jgi:hypothetical protein
MIALVTKWRKTAPSSISWPNTLNFKELYSETNLPPGFTLGLYQKFNAYVEKLGSLTPTPIDIYQNIDANDGAGNIINSRVFIDDSSYDDFKVVSNAIESERNELLSLFGITRTVKVYTDVSQIILVLENITNYNYLDTLVSS